jgi:hypothetical protein
MIDSTCKNDPAAVKAKHYIIKQVRNQCFFFGANFWSLGDFYFYFPKLWRMSVIVGFWITKFLRRLICHILHWVSIASQQYKSVLNCFTVIFLFKAKFG